MQIIPRTVDLDSQEGLLSCPLEILEQGERPPTNDEEEWDPTILRKRSFFFKFFILSGRIMSGRIDDSTNDNDLRGLYDRMILPLLLWAAKRMLCFFFFGGTLTRQSVQQQKSQILSK